MSAAVTNEMVKKLRESTGAGMMDCKRALEATGGDMQAAVEHLRKKGAAVAQKRGDRTAREGMIVTRVAAGGRLGVVVEVNCETDFVARSQDFGSFARTVAEAVEAARPADVASLLGAPASGGRTVAQTMEDLLAKVGEKVDVRRFHVFETPGGTVTCYTHLGSKIGVLVELSGGGDPPALGTAGRDVAMQIAAMNPLVIGRDQIDNATVERELDIYRTQARNEGKPEQILDRIAQGKLEKFYQEVCLLEQTFIRDPGKTIRDFLKEASAGGPPVTVARFQRYQLGEEAR
ncbi:MAG: translation elongation factor Ts [Bacteroidota bacterium]